MSSESAGAHTGLTVVGAVARLLSSGLGVEEAVAAAATLMYERLPLRGIRIVLRRPHDASLWLTIAPTHLTAPGNATTLETVEPLSPTAKTFDLVHHGERLGILEAELSPGTEGYADQALTILADLLAPFVAAIQLSEHLAYEVAVRTREVEEQRRFTGLIIDSLPIGLYVVDRDYRIQIWNRKRETGTQGLRRDDVVGRRIFEVLTRQPADQLKAELDTVFETGQISQLEIEVPAGEESRFFRISKIPMRLDGERVSHVISVGEDVTEWQIAHQRILQSEKLAAIGQLAAGIMHEINNPLATIGACAAAIEGRLGEVAGPARGSLKEYADIIDHEVQRCTAIVDGLLDFSRPRKGGKTKAPADVNELVENTLFLLKHHQRFKRLTVVRELAPGLPSVTANPEQLIQAFMALMLNALDAMEHRDGSLTVRTRQNARGDEVMVEFEDTGSGIPRAELSKIFEPFYTTKPQGRGTGLGLSICYGIIEDHMGRLDVESHPGFGTIFRVVLPIHGKGVAG
ncbi:MAG TPA: ATP-binding protein [Gemmatimonadales bacterium]|nr:ATP-binding protein [Gemmatimonadales bacterium]